MKTTFHTPFFRLQKVQSHEQWMILMARKPYELQKKNLHKCDERTLTDQNQVIEQQELDQIKVLYLKYVQHFL